jgi:hypothetical protein
LLCKWSFLFVLNSNLFWLYPINSLS